MRPDASTHGILLLVRRDAQKQWTQPSTKRLISFEDGKQHLDQAAARLRHEHRKDLRVAVIDVTTPRKASKKGAAR